MGQQGSTSCGPSVCKTAGTNGADSGIENHMFDAETPIRQSTLQSYQGLDGKLHEDVLEIDDKSIVAQDAFKQGRLSIVILGASGDLAKKKTYPSLMDLFISGFLPPHVVIMGFARSKQTSEEFRAGMKPWLLKKSSEHDVETFLQLCEYFQGTYGNPDDFKKLHESLTELESRIVVDPTDVKARKSAVARTNRLFYFAIPPDAFLASARSIKASAMANGFNRLIVEKPFGHDLESATQLSSDFAKIFSEDYIFRIDHYLGKETVQNLLMFRFGNGFLEPLFNKHHIASIKVTFKEAFGTEGRGGYFTNYGIIRDIIQNHLMQVVSIVCMDPPKSAEGNAIRDAKVNVMKSMRKIDRKDVVLGQYTADIGKQGYLQDDSIKDFSKAKMVPTYCAMVMYIDNERWRGVPIMVKAGKALEEGKAEIRIQFKDAESKHIFGNVAIPRNEMVFRLQPGEVIYMKAMMKTPGLSRAPMMGELDLTYKRRFVGAYLPDAYTRLILEALRGRQEDFVRSDEIMASWQLFDPLLKELESGPHAKTPLPYKYGSRGPKEGDELFERAGFKFDSEYKWELTRRSNLNSTGSS